VRAILRDAAMQEEVCPIIGNEIDITNGAVTSCFHIFEKNAITKWLSTPSSQEKCPICSAKCIAFTLNGE
jgi:SUMO ligase MMS21 Smc5/6 complex component